MPVKSQINYKTIMLVLSVVVITMTVGILLRDQVTPVVKKPLIAKEVLQVDKNKTASIEDKTIQHEIAAQNKKHSDQIKKLNIKASAKTNDAEGLIAKADQLISKAGLKQPTTGKAVPEENQKISKRLADVRDRLERLKQ